MDHQIKSCVIDVEVNDYSPWKLDSKLIVIGLKDCGSGRNHIFHHPKEDTLLMMFLRQFNKNHYNRIIGYNIRHDTRFILSRCLRYNIAAQSFFSATRVDVMTYLKNGKYRPGKLGEWSRYITNSNGDGHTEAIRRLYQHGDIANIIKHNESDLNITFQLWKRLKFVLYANPLHNLAGV